MPGNPLVRFDEGRVGRTARCRPLSYSTVKSPPRQKPSISPPRETSYIQARQENLSCEDEMCFRWRRWRRRWRRGAPPPGERCARYPRHAFPQDQGRQRDHHAAFGGASCRCEITTDQAGLYGYGCATFTQRADLVVPAVEKYLKPFLIGKPADRIETSGRPATTVPTGATARFSTTPSAAWTRRYGTSRAARRACPSINFWAGRCAKPAPPTPASAATTRRK